MTTFQFYLAIFIFCLTYAGIMSEKIPRTICALAGGGAMIYCGYLTQAEAFQKFVDWNTLGLLAGMMILISVVKKSGFFEAMSLWAVKVSKGRPKELLVILGLLTGFCASFMDAVTAVLLITPMTISLCRRINVTPIPTLIAEVLLTNIGGSGTMVGDPPNVMIGSSTHLVFNDFALNTGPAALICTAACLVYLEVIYGKVLPKTRMSDEELASIDVAGAIQDTKILHRSLFVLVLTIFGFIIHNMIGLESATIALTGGFLAVLICGVNPHLVFREVDWDSLFFFIGLFILVGGLEVSGVIEALAVEGIKMFGSSAHTLTFAILWLSGLASAFIDNIPFTATMIPLIKEMQTMMGLPHADYMWWALSIGACYGGNGTLIGASPNVIMVAIAAKEGYNITFGHFFIKCFPMMLVTLVICTVYIEVRYFMLAGL
jgi:Na+/H+ antiporter NhaD/arsenite permease-like protein